MKKILLAVCACFLLSAPVLFTSCNGCKEIGPNVNLTKPVVDSFAKDTTWMLSSAEIAALTTDDHNVLVEEFTGQSCNNCPGGHSTIEAAAVKHPGHVNAIGMYPYNIPQANPPSGSVHDFRDTLVQTIAKYVAGASIGGLPSAFIDRVPVSGQMEIDGSAAWSGIIDGRILAGDSVNLAIKSTFNTTTMMATITTTVVYTKPVSTKQNLSIVIVEDTMYDLQEFPDSVHSNYLFTNVFRDMVSSAPSGDPILDSITVKMPGRVYRHISSYKLITTTPAIDPKHCRVIAYINSTDGTDHHILQSAQTKLTGP